MSAYSEAFKQQAISLVYCLGSIQRAIRRLQADSSGDLRIDEDVIRKWIIREKLNSHSAGFKRSLDP